MFKSVHLLSDSWVLRGRVASRCGSPGSPIPPPHPANCTTFRGALKGDTYKRYLTGITILNQDGVAQPGFRYTYYLDPEHEDGQPGALKSITWPRWSGLSYAVLNDPEDISWSRWGKRLGVGAAEAAATNLLNNLLLKIPGLAEKAKPEAYRNALETLESGRQLPTDLPFDVERSFTKGWLPRAFMSGVVGATGSMATQLITNAVTGDSLSEGLVCTGITSSVTGIAASGGSDLLKESRRVGGRLSQSVEFLSKKRVYIPVGGTIVGVGAYYDMSRDR